MSNHVIELGGESRKLKYTTFSVSEIEGGLGESLLDPNFFLEPSYRKMLYFIWGGLLHSNPKLTPRHVAQWLDEGSSGQAELAEKYSTALRAYLDQQGFSDSGEAEEKNGSKANG